MKPGVPSRIEITAVQRVVEALPETPTFEDLSKILPVVANLDERAHLHPLEKELLTQLPHLQHVCHRPRTRLTIEEERVAISRARRIPVRAAAELVARPGDWETRTLTTIRPARILATQVEDEWNLYENRMTARLVDHLLAWTAARLDELGRLVDMESKGQDFQSQTRGSHRRAARLFDLWGLVFKDQALAQELRRTLHTLARLRRSMQSLLDSPLYTNIPRGAFVAPALRPTNILVNDQHYRKVAALWRAWVRYGHHHEPTQEELNRRRQAERDDFETFARALVARALSELGYRTVPGPASAPSESIELSGPTGRARLVMRRGATTFRVEDRELSIVPVVGGIEREDPAAMWGRMSMESGSRDVLWLTLGQPEELASLDPTTARAFGGWERPPALLVSAWSLDCSERVARVLRQWEAPLRLRHYPPRTRVMPDPGVPLPDWLRRAGQRVALVRPPNMVEQEALRERCDTRERELQRAQKDAARSRQTFDPGQLSSLGALRSLSLQATELDALTVCPVCGRTGATLEPRADGEDLERWSWWCACDECRAEWGVFVCKACARTFPVLQPYVERPEALEATDPAALDRAFGRDLWAEPRLGGDSRSFRCTRCGA